MVERALPPSQKAHPSTTQSHSKHSMTPPAPSGPIGTSLVIGASRGLGLALVEELVRRGSEVVATVRSEVKEGTFPKSVDVIEVRPPVLQVESASAPERWARARCRALAASTRMERLASRDDRRAGDLTTSSFAHFNA